MNKLMRNGLLGSMWSSEMAGMSTNLFTPAANTREDMSSYSVQLALPGVKKEDVNISLERAILTIEGERKDEQNEAEYSRQEFCFGTFKRSFILPETVSREDIKASFDNGILTLTLPKGKSEQKTTINIS